MSAVPDRYLSLDEYFLLEEMSGIKHEYYQGVAYAMTGGSVAHNLIIANTVGQLSRQLEGKDCTVFPSDLRLKVEATGIYTYPDIMVICGAVHNADKRKDTVANPSVLFEVLSPGTANYDRDKKFQHYQTIETLRDYVIISQDSACITQYTRHEGQSWLPREYTQIKEAVHLASIGCQLELMAIYRKVSFDDSGQISRLGDK